MPCSRARSGIQPRNRLMPSTSAQRRKGAMPLPPSCRHSPTATARNLRSGLPKHNRMLNRQRLDAAFPLQAMRRGFTPYLLLAHLVQRLNRNCRILGAIFDEDDASAGLEGGDDAVEDFRGIGEFVIHIDHDHKMTGSGLTFRHAQNDGVRSDIQTRALQQNDGVRSTK